MTREYISNVCFSAVLTVLVLLSACEKDKPAENKAHIAALDSLIRNEISAGHFPGAVLQVKKGDQVLHREAYGQAQKYRYGLQPLEKPERMTAGHLFDLASLTKVCATTYGIMSLIDQGRIRIDDPIHTILPEFGEGEKRKITIRHLLTHSAGLRQWVPTYYGASGPREQYRYISELPLRWKVGSGRHYSDLGFMLLAEIIKRKSGKTMDRYLEEQLYRPLGLDHTLFNPDSEEFKQIAATSHGNPFEKQMVYDDDFGYRVEVDPSSWDGWREYTLRGEVNDGNAWYAGKGVGGHAGLFSTVDELQVLVDLLLRKGLYRGERHISEAVIDTFLQKDRFGNALGWAMDKEFISAEGSPEGTFGHTGFTGTSIVAVPGDSLSIILLTNRQNVGRQQNGYYYDLGPLRQQIFDVVWDSSSSDP